MQYLGGKEKISKQICTFLESQRKPGQIFTDLTVGGASIISKMSTPKKGYDIHKALITLYQALSNDTIELPNNVSENEHKKARNLEDTNPMKAFIGFGCSFGGDYFRGYAKNNRNTNFAKSAKNSLNKKFKTLKGIKFEHISLFDYKAKGELIYIDPPYINTSAYAVKFNHSKFWDKVRELSVDNAVYVSEYLAPDDFNCVFEVSKKLGLRTKQGGQELRVEKVFKYKG